jgi:N-acetylglucosaminyldiphosphoundecaprenol N-acetyl-beta-D-mannosaminyltransferase
MSNDFFVLKMKTNPSSIEDALSSVCQLPKGSYVCISNVHMCMETFYDESFLDVVNSANLVFADGRPIFWVQKLCGIEHAEQVRGQDLMMAVCDYASKNHRSVGLYGGTDEAELALVVTELKRLVPNLKISYQYSPPFRALSGVEMESICEDIRKSEVDFLFVGIGCPKQEIWMHKFSKETNSISLGVGAAFNFISGTKKHAPLWMQKVGLEWLFRLLSEPRRLWKRYLKHNPRFLFYAFKQVVLKKVFIKKGNYYD